MCTNSCVLFGKKGNWFLYFMSWNQKQTTVPVLFFFLLRKLVSLGILLPCCWMDRGLFLYPSPVMEFVKKYSLQLQREPGAASAVMGTNTSSFGSTSWALNALLAEFPLIRSLTVCPVLLSLQGWGSCLCSSCCSPAADPEEFREQQLVKHFCTVCEKTNVFISLHFVLSQI